MIDLRCVVSFTEGRLRLRHPALKDTALADLVTTVLGQKEGITSVAVNPRVGSLLLFYDPTKISRAALMELAEEGMAFFPEEQKAQGAVEGQSAKKGEEGGLGQALSACLFSRNATRLTNRFMLGTFLLSLASAALGRFTLHVLAGGLFTVAGVQHILAHRKAL